MRSNGNETLEGIARRISVPEPAYERMLGRRDRRHRNQRITAGVAGMAVFVASIWIVTTGMSFDRSETPIEPGVVALDPFITIHAQLTNDQPVHNLFVVRADHAEYWRMFTLDRFDGESWTSTNPNGSEAGVPVSIPGRLGRFGTTPAPGGETLDQTFTIVGDVPGPNALPMGQTPVEISESSFDNVTWDRARGQAFVDGDLKPGMRYRIRSQIAVPSADDLDQLQFDAPADYGRWTQLPTNLDPRFTEIAQQWTVGETSDYRRVLAIQQHFHTGGFVYSTDVEAAGDADALLEFLTQTRAGFCQHYASAMAVLVRALGLPARIAVGYGPGTLQDNGTYLVKSSDAHAWVEVRFPTYGWLQFEPTPGHGALPDPGPGTYLNPVAPTGAS
jgi:Transglutaminase-like superfamily/TgpA N-terminal domain